MEKTITSPRLPGWLHRRLALAGRIQTVAETLADLELHTVCESAICPNRQECWSRGTATFMILGDLCTRKCGFCAVKFAQSILPPDTEEPENVARAVKILNLHHVVITSVARDDLPDEGAGHFALTIKAIRSECPGVTIEVLVPDFSGKEESLEKIARAAPDIFNHNVETVRRLTPQVRFKATYERSLSVLQWAKEHMAGSYIKSGMMLGLGESEEEVIQTMQDLRNVGCDILTIGQYIRPTKEHLPVIEFIPPEKFRFWQEEGWRRGFIQVVSSPLARSSYHAEEAFVKTRKMNRS